MQTNRPNYDNTARSAIYGIIVLFLLIVFLTISQRCTAQTAYLVCTSEGRKTTCTTTDSVQVAQRLVDNVFPASGICLNAELSRSVYFFIENQTVSVYIEKKRLTPRGKLRTIKIKKS
jgi:hypothetical protein